MAGHEHPFLRRLAEVGLYDSAKPHPVAPLTGIAAADAGDPAAARYADAALERECDAVSTAPEGRRNHVLNVAAFSIGQLVAAGHLNENTALNRLTAAARGNGLPLDEIHRTVPRALRDGSAQPREVKLNPPDATPPAFTLHIFKDDEETTPPGGGQPGPDGATAAEGADPFRKLKSGGAFIFDEPAEATPIWGDKQYVLWASGESLMLVGPPGVGKTTTAQQVVLARLGLTDTFLGFTVQHTKSKVLYLAMDRPRQIARSMRRMVNEGDRDLLDERLTVWPGPLPQDIAKAPNLLVILAEEAGADTIIIDSVKDAAVKLVDSEMAGNYNRARQNALAAGIEVLEIAHQKKTGSNGGPPKTLADVHGGMEITAGTGSVFLVWGEPGDPVVEFRHLKQPMEVVGPLKLVHDHQAGCTSIFEKLDAIDVLRGEPRRQFNVKDVATLLNQAERAPTDAEKERVRRRLEKLVEDGLAKRAADGSPYGAKRSYTYQVATPDTTWMDT